MSFYAGFDIGGTNARMTLFDADLEPGPSARRTIRNHGTPEEIVEVMLDLLAESTDTLKAIDAVGVGLAAQLSADGELVVNAPNLGWRDVKFAEQLRQGLDSRGVHPDVAVVNDLSAQVWGERLAGVAQGFDDVLAVYVGTGVGGAMICSGQLLTGGGGKAGEIGHAKVVVGGRQCGCGGQGCLEAYAGGVHLEAQVQALGFENDHPSQLLKSADEAVANGHAELAELWRRVSDYLAITVANAVTLLNPNLLVIGGGVLNNLDELRSRFLSKTTPLIAEAARDDLEIRQAQLGDLGGVLGAAALAARVQDPRLSDNNLNT